MARVARMNAARERKRLERMAGEEPRVEWRGRLEMTVTFQNHLTNETHALEVFRGRRRDQYDAQVDGKPWKPGISATGLATYFRRKLSAHIAHE